jgi:uncharacterized membrane protein
MSLLITVVIVIGLVSGIGYWLSGTSPQKTASQLGRNGFAGPEDPDM